jgi:hypothetical protein
MKACAGGSDSDADTGLLRASLNVLQAESRQLIRQAEHFRYWPLAVAPVGDFCGSYRRQSGHHKAAKLKQVLIQSGHPVLADTVSKTG